MNRIVSNRKQLERLVELMEETPDVARGMLAKTDLAKKWDKIAVELNSLGPPQRDSTKWQRVWVDQKTKIKKKITNNKIEMTATGGGSNNLTRLTDTEEAVSRLMNFSVFVDPPGVEFGMEVPNFEGTEDEEAESEHTESPKGSQQKSANRDNKEKKRFVLLEKQTSTQEIFYNKMISRMDGFETKLEGIEKSLKNMEYYSKKIYNLKKRKKK